MSKSVIFLAIAFNTILLGLLHVSLTHTLQADIRATHTVRLAIPDDPPEARVLQVCREDDGQVVADHIVGLISKGLTYKGVLNQNGINCTRVLFANR